jgi:hypothetical protein
MAELQEAGGDRRAKCLAQVASGEPQAARGAQATHACASGHAGRSAGCRGRLTSLDSLTIVCQGVASSGRCQPRQIGKLGALKLLTIFRFDELQEMPDLIELTALGSLTIEWCGKLKALPRRFGELGALRELTLCGLDGKLQEMPDLIGLTALGSLTIEYCKNLRALPEKSASWGCSSSSCFECSMSCRRCRI